ncbi:Retrovirus-related Pol polyprotein from transposon RE1 [Vitis vinifera]|uniref:Retrovirus-related Pol polyprotein from transposon RE1 n=1 Tax=Vitis vinifera TaxID=29760 RepID=A0A438BZQ8_VITVI|nr:Retrovirus-related Pol polyprotein from transposon RE1 [Vitis vinifera]
MAVNPVTRPRSKHIAIDYHFVRELVDKGTLKIDFVPSHLQLADSLTKGVTKPQFYLFRSKLSVLPSTTLTLQGVIRENQILHDTCCITFLLAEYLLRASFLFC